MLQIYFLLQNMMEMRWDHCQWILLFNSMFLFLILFLQRVFTFTRHSLSLALSFGLIDLSVELKLTLVMQLILTNKCVYDYIKRARLNLHPHMLQFFTRRFFNTLTTESSGLKERIRKDAYEQFWRKRTKKQEHWFENHIASTCTHSSNIKQNEIIQLSNFSIVESIYCLLLLFIVLRYLLSFISTNSHRNERKTDNRNKTFGDAAFCSRYDELLEIFS